VLQVRRDLDLRLKSIDADDGAEVWAKDLERDAPVVTEVPREKDSRHAALTDQSFNRVPIGEGGGESVGREHASPTAAPPR
jgi:hypothetical protein